MTTTKTQDTAVVLNSSEAVAETPVEKLKREAANHKKNIQAQKTIIEAFQSIADKLITRYHRNESVFEKAAFWYGNLSWWAKSAFFLPIAGVFWVSIALGTLMFALYTTLALFFIDHYQAAETREARLKKDIVALEASLSESVEHLRVIEAQLSSVLTSLCEMNIQQAKDIEAFKTKVSQLEQQTQRFTDVTEQVSITQNALATSGAKLSQSFTDASACFNGLNEAMGDGLRDLADTDAALVTQIDALSDDHTVLRTLTAQMGSNQTHLAGMAAALRQLLDKLNAHVEAHEPSHTPVDNIMPVHDAVKTKGILAQADETMMAARLVLDEQEHNAVDIGIASTDTSNNRRSSTVAALLARAKHAVALSQVKPSDQGLGVYTHLLQ